MLRRNRSGRVMQLRVRQTPFRAEIRKPGVEYLTFAHDPVIQKKRLEMLKRAEELYMKIRGK